MISNDISLPYFSFRRLYLLIKLICYSKDNIFMVELNCYCSERTDIKCSCPKTYLHCNDKPRGVGNYHIWRYGMCHFLGCLFSSTYKFWGITFGKITSSHKFWVGMIKEWSETLGRVDWVCEGTLCINYSKWRNWLLGKGLRYPEKEPLWFQGEEHMRPISL